MKRNVLIICIVLVLILPCLVFYVAKYVTNFSYGSKILAIVDGERTREKLGTNVEQALDELKKRVKIKYYSYL